MSTPSDTPLPDSPPPVSTSPAPGFAPAPVVPVREFIPCLLWAALSLGIIAWWLWARGLEMGAPFYLGTAALAVASLLLFIWATTKRKVSDADAEVQMRPILTIVSFAASGVLLLLAVWLCLVSTEKLQMLAEVSTLAVMGLICLLGALALRLTPASLFSREVVLQGLVTIRPQLGIIMAGLGLALAGLGVYFLIGIMRVGDHRWTEFVGRFPNGGPEALGLIFIGLVFLGGGLYTILTQDRPATLESMRLLLLFTGSLTGLSIAVATALRVAVWWTSYFAGGIRMWQDVEGWRFWLCAYVELFGLFLLFGSLLLARVDIRVHVGMRRLLYGYNAGFAGILLLAILVVVNIIAYVKLPPNMQWTESLGLHSLSGASKLELETLKSKVSVYVIMPRGGRFYQEVRNLLDNCQAVADTNKLVVEYLSPDLDPVRYRNLKRTYPEIEKPIASPMSMPDESSGSGLLVVYGEGAEEKTLPHTFLTDKDLGEADMDMMTGRQSPPSFKGEEALMETIQMLSENKVKPKVYFTQGSGEIRVDDMDTRMETRWIQSFGASDLVTRLRKDNYEVSGLFWGAKPPGKKVPEIFTFSQKDAGEKHEVPDDCRVLVIANPEKAFAKDVLEAIDRYMDKPATKDKPAGKLMILSRAGISLATQKFVEDGMEALCKKYNVQVVNDMVLGFSRNNIEDVIFVKATVPRGSQNKVAREFTNKFIKFSMPRTVRPLKDAGTYKAETVLQVDDDLQAIWLETQVSLPLLQNPLLYANDLLRKDKMQPKVLSEPAPVGAAFTDLEGKPRGVVLGDYMFITTEFFREPTESAPVVDTGYNFFRSNLEWLADRPVVKIGIPPLKRSVYTMGENPNSSRLILLPISLLVLGLTGMGVGIWIVPP